MRTVKPRHRYKYGNTPRLVRVYVGMMFWTASADFNSFDNQHIVDAGKAGGYGAFK